MALDEKNVYATDEFKNLFLTMTKEQILTAITQAVSTGEIKDIDAGFVTKLQEVNKQGVVRFWFGTMAEFEALTEKDDDTLYLFTDDPTLEDFEKNLDDIMNAIKNIVLGETAVGKAEKADGAETAANYDEQEGSIKNKFEDIDKRLEELGFNSGAVTLAFGTASVNSIKRQGEYVIIDLIFSAPKQSSLSEFFTIPENFRPKQDMTVFINRDKGSGSVPVTYRCKIEKSTGKCTLDKNDYFPQVAWNDQGTAYFNIGYETEIGGENG